MIFRLLHVHIVRRLLAQKKLSHFRVHPVWQLVSLTDMPYDPIICIREVGQNQVSIADVPS